MKMIDDAGETKSDSVFMIPPANNNNLVPKKIDSPVLINPQPQVLSKKDSVMKKPRGVKGISDSDYRFVLPKRDSTER